MKFLLVRFSAIGDCVMAAHAATAVRQAHPEAFLAWAIEGRCAPVADTGTLLSLRQEFPRDKWKAKAWSPAVWWSSLRTYTGLRKHRFDLGVDLQGHSKTALCLYLAKPARRVAAHATDSLARRLNPVVPGDAAAMHVVEWNRHVLGQLGQFPAVQIPIMPPLRKEREAVLQLIRPAAESYPVVTISTGAGARDKQWPVDRWMSVASAIEDQGLRVFFLGGPTDPQPTCPPEQNLVGKLPLGETMAAVASSVLHLAGDTGSGHIAAAYGVPVVSIFGPTDPQRYRPYTNKGIVLIKGRETANIEPDQVVVAAMTLLEGRG